MLDRYGRKINKLRVSVGESCELSCTYCVEEIGGHRLSPNRLKVSEMLQLIEWLKLHAGIETIRITGGEPLLFRPLPELIAGIRALGIHAIGMTTNGQQLAPRLASLHQAGLSRLNVSLDSLHPENFRRLARGGKLERTLRGLEVAQELGLPVKLNMVVMSPGNAHEILDILEYGLKRSFEVRFLELMPMGHLYRQNRLPFFSMAEILSQVAQRYRFRPIPAEPDSTSLQFQIEEGGTFGIIPNESAPFCATCSRLRLTSTGQLIGCLSNPQEVSLRPLLQEEYSSEQLKRLVAQAIGYKRTVSFTGSQLGMSSVGG